ncbi:phosphoribosyltransferase-like protein [Rhexocercosporidium sp. MPI-PUGE-AT-0058]|nr:phosphoribosyltransferase-like protein [Rhexocercosporidium sp. MPI-PUGE-AT-0058]
MANAPFTEPTTDYWQEILPASEDTSAPWQYGYPARLPDSRILKLPIRALNANEAVASLIINQAAIDVTAQLGAFLADAVRRFNPEVIIGLPTLGLSLAPIIAQGLGHKRYVPLGYSRKFWYTDSLSTDVSSITSPSGEKKLHLDPNQVSLVKGKRAMIIDDAVSSGKTLNASWDFLEEVGGEIVGCGVVMKQGSRWQVVLGEERAGRVCWVFECPLLRRVEGGWDVRE